MQKLISTVTLCALCAFAAVAPTWAQDAEKPAAETTKKIEKPQPAASIMDAAYMKAKKEHKPILVMFHATWCGWCKRLEAVMDKPEFKKMFASNYVLVNLDVMENGAKKETDENAGGIDLMNEW